MGEEITTLGSIHISPKAVATIAYHATLQSYGVVGLAPKNLAEGLSIIKDPARGVAVTYEDDRLVIDIHVIIEYGTRITSVADSIVNTVRYSVEKVLGMHVHEINIHIHDLHVSTD
jgi:uncharacterized alkaline shock family protein YloU